MNYKERIMAAIKGESCDVLPFVPRLDLWFKANKQNGTLPDKFKNADLLEISRELDMGYHAVVPDFRDFESPYDAADIGIGIHKSKSIFYTVELDIEKKTDIDGDEIITTYYTPYGEIVTKVFYDDTMRRSGVTLGHITKHAIETINDYQAVGYIYEHARAKPRYENYYMMDETVGDRGVIVSFHSLGGSPVHLYQRELVSFENFCFHSYDCPELIDELESKIGKFFDESFNVAANSPSDIVLSGANYDSTTTYPHFFKKYITPYLSKNTKVLHDKNKYLLTHTDGDNSKLLNVFNETDFDIADSICPAPMTPVTLKEVIDALDGNKTIWGGIPSNCVLENSMTDYDFEKYIDVLLQTIGDGRNFIVSIADTTPPAAKFERILTIAKKVREFGPVK